MILAQTQKLSNALVEAQRLKSSKNLQAQYIPLQDTNQKLQILPEYLLLLKRTPAKSQNTYQTNGSPKSSTD